MSRWRRLEIDALIAANGVRRSCDTACSSDARRLLAAASSDARRASPCRRSLSAATVDLRGERVEDALVLRRELTTAQRQRRHPVRGRGRRRPRRERSAARLPTTPPLPAGVGLAQQRRSAEPERRAQLSEHVVERHRPRHRPGQGGERLGLGGRREPPASASAPPGRRARRPVRRPRRTWRAAIRFSPSVMLNS